LNKILGEIMPAGKIIFSVFNGVLQSGEGSLWASIPEDLVVALTESSKFSC